MSQSHTPKERRQAKHIVASYKKRGVPMKKSKQIAWAVVNKQQNESWMFNGAGQPVFMGQQGNVSQFNPQGSTSPGKGHMPSEVARMLVKEIGLRQFETVSKKVIEDYLTSMGIDRSMAVDVAISLRDTYGVTPTVDEASLYGRSGALIEELSCAANDVFTMQSKTRPRNQRMSDVEIVGSFIQQEFIESKDAGYDATLAEMATLSVADFCDIVDFHQWVGPAMFNYIESVVSSGQVSAAQQLVEGICSPDKIKSMTEDVQVMFGEDAAEVIRDHLKKRQMAKPISTHKQLKLNAKDNPDVQKPNEMDARAKAHADFNKGASHKTGALHTDPKLGDRLLRLKAKNAKAAGNTKADGNDQAIAKKSTDKQLKSKNKSNLSSDEKKKIQLAKPIDGRKQLKLRAKDDSDMQKPNEMDARAKAHASSPLSGALRSDPKLGDRLAKLRDKKAAAKAAEPSRLKKAGMKAVDLMKRAHTPSKYNPDVSPALKKMAGGVARVGVGLLKHAAHSAGQAVGSAAKGLVKGAMGTSGDSKKADQDKTAGKKSKSPGVAGWALGHVAKAAGRFVRHVADKSKEGFKKATPGIQHVAGSNADASKKGKKLTAPPVGGVQQDSIQHKGRPLQESDAMTPLDAAAGLDGTTIADMAMIEAISELTWDKIADVAGFMTLESMQFLALIQAFNESRSVFRAEWSEFEASGAKPPWMNLGSFVTLAKLSLDEAVIPRLVYWAGRALQSADAKMISHIGEAYPELGKVIYGPAGDPKEGPELAKAFMTPHPAETLMPIKGLETTRMFSDPKERVRQRKAKLADVMKSLDGMRKQAALAGVPPEGMFLDLYRDMHREKVRYS